MLTDEAFLRYNRQIALEELGETGQVALQNSRLLIVGAGGLGSPAALYLAAAGIGHIVIADGDSVERSNLQRQIIYRDHHQNDNKARCAAEQLKQLNPLVAIRPVQTALTGQQLNIEVSMADIVLDCSDNFSTRYAINRACFEQKKILISAAAIRWQGQLVSFDFRQQQGPCYHCLFPQQEQQDKQENSCRTSAISGPVVGVMGTMQALEAIKAITDCGEVNFAHLQLFDGLQMKWQRLTISRDVNCPICATSFEQDLDKEPRINKEIPCQL
ncbi:molybdopterin biosynthesis protein MoeB [Vibrio sp. MACH09]|nr:HesA/MoeB/ThiF family protein [Vibrio sp. MACH09]GLO63363.1 molybdopterin biosynthesis protein MoeB [Vibrio sp. MACH09]